MSKQSFRKRLMGLVIATGFSLGGGLVIAQDAPPSPPAPPAASEEAPPAPVPTAKKPILSPADMVKQVADYAQKMQGILKRVVQLQEVARRQKDVIKLNCVNDKHLQIKQLMNIADGASTNLQEAIARNDDDAREHEFHRIQITSEQVTVLATEAENCIGEDFTFFGDTQVTVEQPEEPEDPTQAADPGVPDIEPIPVASPFV